MISSCAEQFHTILPRTIFVDGVLAAPVDAFTALAATAGDGVIIGAGAVADGVAVDASGGGRARLRDEDETGSKVTVALILERNVLEPRDTFFKCDRHPFSGVAWRMADLLPGSATSA